MRILPWFGLAIVIFVAILIILGYGVQDSQITSITLNELRALTSESFTLSFEMKVENPSLLTVPVQLIKYSLFLNNQSVGEGIIQSFLLSSGETPVEVTQRFVYEDMLSLQGIHTVRITGVLYVLGFQIPFSENFQYIF